MKSYTLRVTCASTRGIVAAISGYLAGHDCNITDSAQFDDTETGRFFMRVSFRSEGGATLDQLQQGIAPIAERFGMEAEFSDDAVKKKVVIMVSRFGHCLNDLLYRWRIGALPIDIVAVISNHMDYQKVVVNHDLPYYCVKVTKENKAQAEAGRKRLKELLTASVPLFKASKFFLNPEMSLADCAMAPIVWRLQALEIPLPKDGAKAIEDYGNRIFRNPGFIRSLTDQERKLRDLPA